jgi:multidrug efflux pump subunit AcrA (membrane-fusion protein)
MGTLRLNQLVKFKFDAFAYAEYGVMPGSVAHIAPEAQIDSAGNASYRVLATLQQTYFRVKDTRTPLLPGMTASAEIVTDQKTLLELIFRPLAEFARTTDAAP